MDFVDCTSHFSLTTDLEMESSRARHWSDLSDSDTSTEWSAETNFKDFDLLKKHPQWGPFFNDFPSLELGKEISGGAQADVYKARLKRVGPFNLVAKVMKGDAPLQAFQAQWPVGMLLADKFKQQPLSDMPFHSLS
jgi:hypothetical protein